MLTDSLGGFPATDILARFFRMERDSVVALDLVAALLGMTRRQGRGILAEDGTPRGLVWDEVAYHLFRLWPRAELLELVGPYKPARIPALFYPTTIALKIPLYVQLAMELQARRAWESDERVRTFLGPVPPRGIHDYISDILHEHIDEETERAMRGKRGFAPAFHFPHERREST